MGSQRFWRVLGGWKLVLSTALSLCLKQKSLDSLVLGVPHQLGKKLEENMCGMSLLAVCQDARMPGWVPVSFVRVDHAGGWRLEETLGVSKSARESQHNTGKVQVHRRTKCTLLTLWGGRHTLLPIACP